MPTMIAWGPDTDRPRWLMPAIVTVMVVGVLVAAGIVSLTTVLYVGMFGGMMFMHLGGHGMHGGHAMHATADGRDGDDGSGGAPANGIAGRNVDGHGAEAGDDDREELDHGQRSSHSCH